MATELSERTVGAKGTVAASPSPPLLALGLDRAHCTRDRQTTDEVRSHEPEPSPGRQTDGSGSKGGEATNIMIRVYVVVPMTTKRLIFLIFCPFSAALYFFGDNTGSIYLGSFRSYSS